MGLLRVIVAAAQKEEPLQFFKDKQIVKGSDLHDLFIGHIESLDPLSLNGQEKTVFQEFHSRASFVARLSTK
jgi:hypothetical protein